MQERQIAEATVQLVIPHRQLRVDVLLLGQPGYAGPLVAKFVDQLKSDALMAGENAAVGDGLQLVVVEMATILHQTAEPGVGILDDRFDRRACFGRRRLKAVRRCFETPPIWTELLTVLAPGLGAACSRVDTEPGAWRPDSGSGVACVERCAPVPPNWAQATVAASEAARQPIRMARVRRNTFIIYHTRGLIIYIPACI